MDIEATMDLEALAADIPLNLARHAHLGTSYSCDRRGDQERESYAATLALDLEELAKLATTETKRLILAQEFSRYRAGYRRRFLDLLRVKASRLSPMIAGPSKFPQAKADKAWARADRRNRDLQEYRERALRAIRKALTPEKAPIMAGDADALDRLRLKLAKAERVQEIMKEANAAIRSRAKEGVQAQAEALMDLGFSERRVVDLLTPDFADRVGFPSDSVASNGQEIRRLRGRIKHVETLQATAPTEEEGEHATMEVCPPENRVRLYFPDKPSKDVRLQLSAAGFRWAPSLKCWQAYINHWTQRAARQFAGLPEE